MEKIEHPTNPHNAEVVDQIATLLINFWPMMRKRLVHINALQSECGMPVSHIQLLALLSQVESLSITQISERFDIAKPNITPMVDRMIAEGLVTRTRSNQDKRIVSVVICDKGRERLVQIHTYVCRIISAWAESMTDAEVDELYGSLESIVRLLKQHV